MVDRAGEKVFTVTVFAKDAKVPLEVEQGYLSVYDGDKRIVGCWVQARQGKGTVSYEFAVATTHLEKSRFSFLAATATPAERKKLPSGGGWTNYTLALKEFAGDAKDPKPQLPGQREQLDVPGKSEPEYTDEEATVFDARIEKLNADRDRKPPKTLKEALAELKIDPKKMRGGGLHGGNATDWVEYRLSPNYTLSAAYTQGAPEGTAFRDVRIMKAEPVNRK